VQGVIVGFRLPEHLESLAVPGYHFHFLTADHKGGGHLLAFRARTLRAVVDRSTAIHTELLQNEAFASVDMSRRNREELDQIMGRTKLK
jgi:acetolactate decarboxylase